MFEPLARGDFSAWADFPATLSSLLARIARRGYLSRRRGNSVDDGVGGVL
jgi:hypothetical protein